jgi:hypothetical protein
MSIDKRIQALNQKLISGAGSTNLATKIQMAALGTSAQAQAARNKASQGIIPNDPYAKYRDEKRKSDRDTKFANYLDGLDLNPDLSDAPDAYRETIMPIFQEMKVEARDVVRQLLKYKPGEEGYDFFNGKLEAIENKSKKMKKELDLIGTDTASYVEDYDNQNLSNANDPDLMDKINNVYTQNSQLSFDEFGNALFNGEKYRDLKLKQPFNKAATEANQFLTMSSTLYGGGKKLDDASKILYQNKVNEMLSKGGWNTHKSLVKDNLLGDAFLSEPGMAEKVNELIAIGDSDGPNSHAARQELQSMLSNRMMDVLDSQANAGFTAAQGDGGDEGLFDYTDMNAYLDDISTGAMGPINTSDFNATLPPGYKYLLMPRKVKVDGKYVDSDTEVVVIKAVGDPSNYALQQAQPTTVFQNTDTEAIKKYFRKLKK